MSGSQNSFRQGPLLVWNGQNDIATVVNEAGEHTSGNHSLKNMFDENPKTCWHSIAPYKAPQSIKIFFKVSSDYRL